MRLHDFFRNRVAFEPPSDMLGDDGGGGSSTGKKVFIGLGIGCAVVLIVIGILFAAGAFKAVTCCQSFQKMGVKMQNAQDYAIDFAEKVRNGEHDAAYSMTTDDFRSRVSKQNFIDAVEAHRERIVRGQPRMFNMQVGDRNRPPENVDDIQKVNDFQFSLQFAAPADEEMLLMHVDVISEGEEPESATFAVDDVRFENRRRVLEMEPPAEAVLRVHDEIRRGNYEGAYNQMSMQFQQETDFDTFRTFIADAGPLLTDADLNVREIDYQGKTRATVMTHATTRDGVNGIIQWELVKGGVPGQESMETFMPWQVAAIAPVVSEKEPTDAPASDAGGADETDVGAAPPDAAAP